MFLKYGFKMILVLVWTNQLLGITLKVVKPRVVPNRICVLRQLA